MTSTRTQGAVVLGMHRSGTSAVTRVINLLGARGPKADDLMPPSPDNPKGYWESLSLGSFNDNLLLALDGTWSGPPDLPQGWFREPRLENFRAPGRSLFAEIFPGEPWVWKDPRNCLVLPFWIDALAIRPAVVLVRRNPLEIVRSIESRDHLSRPLALALWERYLRTALEASRGLPTLVLNYADLLADPERACAEIGSFLSDQGFPVERPPEREIASFLESSLRHAEFTPEDFFRDPDVSDAQRELFRALEGSRGTHLEFVPPVLPPETASTDWLLGRRRAEEMERRLQIEIEARERKLRDATAREQELARALRDFEKRERQLHGLLHQADERERYHQNELRHAHAEIDRLRQEHVESRRQIESLGGALSIVETDRDRWRGHAERVQRLVDDMRASRGWRAIEALRRLRAGASTPPSAPEPVAEEASSTPPAEPHASSHDPAQPAIGSFEELPWRFSGSRPRPSIDRISILVTSHDGSRTGAPLALLGVITELVKRPEFECWVLLSGGGPLEAEFARHAPTLNLDTVARRGVGRERALDTVGSLFARHGARRVALCNTAATPDVNVTLANHGVPIVSWIHELPTSIDAYFGGGVTFADILEASKSVILPAAFVKKALVESYRCDTAKLRVLHYGMSESPLTSQRADARRTVRAELGIPEGAKLVLGCGTVDQRKGSDLFVQIARRVLAREEAAETWFVWVGNPLDGRALAWCEHDAEAFGIAERVRFVGERKFVEPYLLAADVFALTSREDPFPFVNLEAMAAGLPVVAFAEGGGAPEVLADEHGVVVPYLDLDRFAEAVVDLVSDAEKRRAIGERAAARVNAPAFSWARFADELRALLESELGFFPARSFRVSAVVVCYEHERYIAERLESILRQTRPPDEIVFVDDASRDRSVEIAKQIAGSSLVPFKFVLGERNSGSPFAQWIRGIEAASGDLVWIAEGDDSCAPGFLENLVPSFFDPDVVLAYAQSAPVGDDGSLYDPDYRGYTADLSATRWAKSFVASGRDEVRDYLSVKNTIPSASAVVLRLPRGFSLPRDLAQFRFTGDWHLYAELLPAGKVAFCASVLNFHRRHGASVTRSIEKEDAAIVEQLRVKASIFERQAVPTGVMASSIAQTVSEYYRLAELHGLERVPFVENAALRPWVERMRELFEAASPPRGESALFVIGDAEIGGGQIAGVRLANEFAKRDRVFLLNARPDLADEAVAAMAAPNVVPLEGTLGMTPWAAASRSSEENRLYEGPRRIAVVRDLVRFHRIERIVSQIWWADRFTLAVNRGLGIPWFIQMHGCYEALLEHPDWDREFERLAAEVMQRISGLCYSSTKNLEVFEAGRAPRPKRMRQFYNGLDPASVPPAPDAAGVSRERDEYLFCLCSRAIPEKGWEEAIVATIAINDLAPERRLGKRARLLLIGDGDYARSLRRIYAANGEIEFVGQLGDPLPTILACDVGLLPSRFVSESVPSTVIEYLACGKPVIATAVGSIPEMLELDGRRAGQLVEPGLGREATIAALRDAMIRYMTLPELLLEHRENARAVFDERFDIVRVAAGYRAFFDGEDAAVPEEDRWSEWLGSVRARVAALGNASHTSLKFQDDVLRFLRDHAAEGDAVIEVGCYRGGLTAQLAAVCAALGKSLYVIDISDEYLSVARTSVRAVTNDDHVRYFCEDFPTFVSERRCAERVAFVLIDADHRYPGVVKDIAAVYATRPRPFAMGFHDFSLRYATKELENVRVDRAILDSLGEDARYERIGEIAGEGRTLRTQPGDDGHYHEPGKPEGVLLLCADQSPAEIGHLARSA